MRTKPMMNPTSMPPTKEAMSTFLPPNSNPLNLPGYQGPDDLSGLSRRYFKQIHEKLTGKCSYLLAILVVIPNRGQKASSCRGAPKCAPSGGWTSRSAYRKKILLNAPQECMRDKGEPKIGKVNIQRGKATKGRSNPLLPGDASPRLIKSD